MRIAIMGTGGTGGYFGGLLARAGEEVTFIARGAHLEAIRKNGLAIKSVLAGDFTIQAIGTDNPDDIGIVDHPESKVKHVVAGETGNFECFRRARGTGDGSGIDSSGGGEVVRVVDGGCGVANIISRCRNSRIPVVGGGRPGKGDRRARRAGDAQVVDTGGRRTLSGDFDNVR